MLRLHSGERGKKTAENWRAMAHFRQGIALLRGGIEHDFEGGNIRMRAEVSISTKGGLLGGEGETARWRKDDGSARRQKKNVFMGHGRKRSRSDRKGGEKRGRAIRVATALRVSGTGKKGESRGRSSLSTKKEDDSALRWKKRKGRQKREHARDRGHSVSRKEPTPIARKKRPS